MTTIKRPITWAEVLRTINNANTALSNKALADLLNAEPADVSVLTRLMAKAGEIYSIREKKGTGVARIAYSFLPVAVRAPVRPPK